MHFSDGEPDVAAIRAKLMDGLAPIKAFADAIERTPRTVANYIAQGLPVTYIAQTPYVQIEPGMDWLRTRKLRTAQQQQAA
jgi:hypothetical protein